MKNMMAMALKAEMSAMERLFQQVLVPPLPPLVPEKRLLARFMIAHGAAIFTLPPTSLFADER